MKGTGNDLSTIWRKLYFMLIPTCGGRTRYLYKQRKMFHYLGNKIMWQPRKFPADPEFISLGDNVKISANVEFVNHDIISAMLNDKYDCKDFKNHQGCIRIGSNVMIGANTMIMPNVQIGNNVVIGGGSIVTKDIPDNSVAAGIPCRIIGTIEKLEEKYRNIESFDNPNQYWKAFEESRK